MDLILVDLRTGGIAGESSGGYSRGEEKRGTHLLAFLAITCTAYIQFTTELWTDDRHGP